MRKILDTATVPPGGYFVYIDKDSGHRIAHPYYTELKKRAKSHRAANEYPIGSNWNDEFDTNVAENTPTAHSVEYKPPTIVERMSSAGKALYKAALSGFKVVTDEVFMQRKAECESCAFYGGETGVLRIACKKCGCSGIKLHWPSERCPIGKW